MKTPPKVAKCISIAVFVSIAGFGLIGCAPPSGSNNANSSGNSTASVTPAATATPTPTPLCNDNAINQQLVTIFMDPNNAHGNDGFDDIRNTVNFYSRNCKIYLWGYSKSLGRFKKLGKVFGVVPLAITASSIDNDNLYIQRNEYPHLPSAGACASGFKPCGDICIPEGDSCWSELSAARKSN
jgi:hypothetical protein